MKTVSQAYVERDGKLRPEGTTTYIDAPTMPDVRNILKALAGERGEPVVFLTRQQVEANPA